MRILILVFICTLLTGCGIFLKTKKIDKQLSAAEVSKEIKVSSETNEGRVDKSKELSYFSQQFQSWLKIYPKPGTPVTVGSDGSISGEVDSVIHNVREKSDAARDLANDVNETLQRKTDSLGKLDSVGKKEVYNLEQTKEPSSNGIFTNWIGGGVVAFLLIVGLVWWFFGRLPKS